MEMRANSVVLDALSMKITTAVLLHHPVPTGTARQPTVPEVLAARVAEETQVAETIPAAAVEAVATLEAADNNDY